MKKTFGKILVACGGITLGALIFFVITGAYLLITKQPKENGLLEETPRLSSAGGSILNNIALEGDKGLSSENADKESLEDRLVKQLQDRYGDTILEKRTQALLLQVKSYLLKLYPEDGTLRFYNILKRAFPDLADEIMETLKKMEEYLSWVENSNSQMDQMNGLEKEGFLWKKRKELFGDDAGDIWSDEIAVYEERKKEVRNTIKRLAESYDTTIYEKLADYQNTLANTYKDTPEEHILQNKDLLAKVFFGLDSVQNELKDMGTEMRKLEINKIRSEMGYTQAQIEKLEKFDDYRNKRWDNGLSYMDERDRVASEFNGPELETKLKELREKYFKHEAKTIELEENDGFFRYTRTRVYGRN